MSRALGRLVELSEALERWANCAIAIDKADAAGLSVLLRSLTRDEGVSKAIAKFDRPRRARAEDREREIALHAAMLKRLFGIGTVKLVAKHWHASPSSVYSYSTRHKRYVNRRLLDLRRDVAYADLLPKERLRRELLAEGMPILVPRTSLDGSGKKSSKRSRP